MSNIFKHLEFPGIFFICAPPKQGKSTFVRQLVLTLHASRKIHYGWVFSSTLHNGDYDFIPRDYVSAVYSDQKLARIMRYQKASDRPAFIIIDDMLGMINFGSKYWKTLCSTYRHYKLTIFFTSQYVYALPPLIRTCTTYAVIFAQFDRRSFEMLYDAFFTDKESMRDAKKFIQERTGNYRFILVKTMESPERRYISGRTSPVNPGRQLRWRL